MKQQLEQIKTAALEAINAAQNSADCENVRVKYLGKKGELTAILKMMGGLSPEERPIMGQLVNTAKAEVDAMLNDINSIIMQCVEGEDPMTAEPHTGCSGSCSSCSGCH